MRPKDMRGENVILGPWYWARSRTGKIAGAGKFLATIGWNEVHFYINGTGYLPDTFASYLRIEDPPESQFEMMEANKTGVTAP